MGEYLMVPTGKYMTPGDWDQFAVDAFNMEYAEAAKVNGLLVVEAETYKHAVVLARGEQPDAQIHSEPGALRGDTPLSSIDKEIK